MDVPTIARAQGSYEEHWESGMALRPEELETIVVALRELGLSYEETAKLMTDVTKDANALRSLWGKPSEGQQKGSRLIKLGLSLIAFPIPTIGIKKSLGAMLIAAGLVQERTKHIHVADVYSTFRTVNTELRKSLTAHGRLTE